MIQDERYIIKIQMVFERLGFVFNGNLLFKTHSEKWRC